jgi:hypothetical protein
VTIELVTPVKVFPDLTVLSMDALTLARAQEDAGPRGAAVEAHAVGRVGGGRAAGVVRKAPAAGAALGALEAVDLGGREGGRGAGLAVCRPCARRAVAGAVAPAVAGFGRRRLGVWGRGAARVRAEKSPGTSVPCHAMPAGGAQVGLT